jgi:hypothetical protein
MNVNYTLRHKSYTVCHSGLDPESSVFLDSCLHRNDIIIQWGEPVIPAKAGIQRFLNRKSLNLGKT